MRSKVFSRQIQVWGGTLLLHVAGAGAAVAAPFCLQNQMIPPQCIYADAALCERDAARQNAVCSVNPREVTMRPGAGQYCVVTSQQVTLCNYYDRASCSADAARNHGVCTYAPTRAPSGAPDPYSASGQ